MTWEWRALVVSFGVMESGFEDLRICLFTMSVRLAFLAPYTRIISDSIYGMLR